MPAQELGTTVALPTTAVQAESDEALMRAVAERRDRGAYACLVERHQRAAYNLARHLTDSAEAAEDVLQEALLRAWASADTFRQDGSARGWLLRIVAREAFRANRRGRAERQRIERRQAREPAREEGPETMTPESDEQLAALHETLRALPEQQRAMLALYFGAELSQEEIGKHFNMPQKTVSRRITEILETLRGRLAQAGLAAAAPLLAADKLGAALLDGEAPPAGLFERIGANLAHAGASASVKAAAAKGAFAAWWLWAAGAAVLAAGAAVAFSGALPQAKSEAPAATPAQQNAPAPTQGISKMAFLFKDGLPSGPEGVDQIGGGKISFGMLPETGRKGMGLPVEEDAHFLIRRKAFEGPLKTTILVHSLKKGPSSIGYVFTDGKDAAATIPYFRTDKPQLPSGEVLYEFYFVDGYGISMAYGNVFSIAKLERLPGDDYISFGGKNLVVLEVIVQTIAREDLPEAARGAAAYCASREPVVFDKRFPLPRWADKK